jgi:hypothetical protein
VVDQASRCIDTIRFESKIFSLYDLNLYYIILSQQDDYRKGIELCKDVAGKTKDHCESSFRVMQCFIENNPNFEIP